MNQKKTVDARFERIEFEGRFVVENTHRPLINDLPTDVDGAEKISAIATNERFVRLFNEKMTVLTCGYSK